MGPWTGRSLPPLHVRSIPRWSGCAKETRLDPCVRSLWYIWIYLCVRQFLGFGVRQVSVGNPRKSLYMRPQVMALQILPTMWPSKCKDESEREWESGCHGEGEVDLAYISRSAQKAWGGLTAHFHRGRERYGCVAGAAADRCHSSQWKHFPGAARRSRSAIFT